MKPPAAAFLAIVILILAGCAAPPPAPKGSTGTSAPIPTATDETGSISGVVVDEERLPIADASVGLMPSRQETRTDALGRYTFNLLTPGQHSVFATRLGFDQAAASVKVEAGQVKWVNMTLKTQAVAKEPYTRTVPKVGQIVFGNAFVQYATQQSNVSGVHEATCNPCQFVVYFEPKPKEAMLEGLWACNCVPPAVNMDVWFKFLSNWTTGSLLDGVVMVNSYLSNREQYDWGPASMDMLRAAKGNKMLFQLHAGTYVNFQQKVETWHSFAYNGPFDDNFTALPPAA